MKIVAGACSKARSLQTLSSTLCRALFVVHFVEFRAVFPTKWNDKVTDKVGRACNHHTRFVTFRAL